MPTLPALTSLLQRSRARLSTSATTLPQINTVLSITEHRSAGGHDYGLIRAHATGHYTVILAATGATLRDWQQLCDFTRIDFGADAWDVVAVTAVADTFPRTDTAHRQWLDTEHHYRLDVADLATDTYLAVTFVAATSAMKSTPDEMAVEVGRRLHTLIGSLHAAGLPTTPLTAAQVAAVGVRAYRGGLPDDPAPAFADIAPDSTPHRVRDVFCHNDLVSATWVIAPHVLEPPHAMGPVLAQLLERDPTTPRTRLAITWRATRIAETIHPDDPIRLTFEPALQRFGATLTITEPRPRTPSVDSVRDRLPLFARLGVRNGYDRHAELFAAGIGLGVLLPEHGDITDEALRHRHR